MRNARVIRRMCFVAVLTSGLALPLAAQNPGRAMNPRREALENQLRMRTSEVVRRRLELNDDQMARLQAANRQFDEQRRELLQRERQTRQELRRELTAEKANQSRVSELLDQTFALERQRFELIQSEQRELAKFLTPVQRAKLLGLQGEMRRRAQQLRR